MSNPHAKKNGVVASRLRPLNSKPVVISNIIIAMVDLKINGQKSVKSAAEEGHLPNER